MLPGSERLLKLLKGFAMSTPTSKPVSKLDAQFVDYAQYHQTSGNQLTHIFGIPLIAIAVLGWLSSVWIVSPQFLQTAGVPLSLLHWDLAVAAIIAVTIRYATLDWRLGLPFSLVLYGLYWIGRALPNSACWAFFVGGWVLQFIGHWVFEKKSPAFTKNIEHLLIGPIWIFAKLTGTANSAPQTGKKLKSA
jgi:uncharacterized membrane protein YGL010W